MFAAILLLQMYSYVSPLPVFVGLLSASGEQLVPPQYVIKASKFRSTYFKSKVLLSDFDFVCY